MSVNNNNIEQIKEEEKERLKIIVKSNDKIIVYENGVEKKNITSITFNASVGDIATVGYTFVL